MVRALQFVTVYFLRDHITALGIYFYQFHNLYIYLFILSAKKKSFTSKYRGKCQFFKEIRNGQLH